ncbi:MAG: carbohydrate kinase, partial [Bacilli bacterium]|nr:carbohydrate kinase [Bacilli bacterium]
MDTKINLQRIIYAVENAEKSVITVFGDYALDKYIYSKPSQDEPSVETGLTAYQIFDTAGYPGIGGTITNNLR